MKNKLVHFASDTMKNLCEQIEDYAEMEELEIVQISAYCDTDKVLDQRAIVIFREEN